MHHFNKLPHKLTLLILACTNTKLLGVLPLPLFSLFREVTGDTISEELFFLGVPLPLWLLNGLGNFVEMLILVFIFWSLSHHLDLSELLKWNDALLFLQVKPALFVILDAYWNGRCCTKYTLLVSIWIGRAPYKASFIVTQLFLLWFEEMS